MNEAYSYKELSSFCFQTSLLLKAAVPLSDGFRIMADDATTKEEKDRLLAISDELEFGTPLNQVLEQTNAFPDYVVRMAKLGDETGTLDEMMESLSVYYDKEDRMIKNIRSAVTYPLMMVGMLLVVLIVLFTKVMPIFEEVYSQLGAELSPVSVAAIKFGSVFSVAALVIAVALLAVCGFLWAANKAGVKMVWAENAFENMKAKSRTAQIIARRRCSAVLALTLHNGMELDKGLELADELSANKAISECISKCQDSLLDGDPYDEAMKKSGLFTGFQMQMIRTGNRSGHLDKVMDEISQGYEEEADESLDRIVSRLEPTIVAVLAVTVGLILLSVMLPLVGVMSSIG